MLSREKYRVTLAAIAIVLIAFAGISFASPTPATSTGYILQADEITSVGSTKESSGYKFYDVGGQSSPVGTFESAGYQLGGGLIYSSLGTQTQGTWVKVVQPNGGETLEVGSIYNLTYIVTPQATEALIRLSTNEGFSWDTLVVDDVAAITGLTTYEWTVPNLPSTECLVSVEAVNNSLWGYDTSDASFKIASLAKPCNLRISIEVDSDTQRKMYLSWDGGMSCNIWTHDGLFSSPGDIFNFGVTYTKVQSGISSGTMVETYNPQGGGASQRYYSVATAGSTNFCDNAVGRYDVTVSKVSVNPNKAFFSVPLQTANPNVQQSVGSQMKESDAVYKYNPDGTVAMGAVYTGGNWYDWQTGQASSLQIQVGTGYLALVDEGSTSPTRIITFVGGIVGSKESSSFNKTILKGWGGICAAYPLQNSLNSAGLNNLSYGGTPAELYLFDANWNVSNNMAALHIAQNTWYDWATGAPSAMSVTPGQVYWLNEPLISVSTWEQTP